ncbi:putative metal-binding motif-containing protein [Candidatus Woesearchaeota archaeon]|nr:putative metal-binding motif-containing protein [Candidatus Woesearchaeota archaeon]
MDRLNRNASRICLKDADVDSLDEITSTCTGENETKLGCNSTLQNGYNCTIIDSGSRYIVIGLKHSAAQEFCTDNDEDGYGEGCVQQDCNDNNAAINPGASEIAYNGIDDDCSGSDLTDVDSDGYNAVVAGGNDCNDNSASINPAATDACGNDIDEDCSGTDLACPAVPPPSPLPTPPPSPPPSEPSTPAPSPQPSAPSSGGGGGGGGSYKSAAAEEPFVIISREIASVPAIQVPATESEKSGARAKDKKSLQEKESESQASAAKKLAQKVKETYVVNKTAEAAGKVAVEAKKTGYFKLDNFYFIVLMVLLFGLSMELSRRVKKIVYGK